MSSRRHPQQGMTLIELLVTMVIMGFVIATLSGALSQISQMLRVSSEQTNGFLARWTQSRALYDIVGNMVLDPTLDKPFAGTPTRMELVSLSSPDAPLGQPRRLVLALAPIKDLTDAATQVKLLPLDSDSDSETESSSAQAIAEFKGRLEFRYLDKQQREHSQWPVANDLQSQALPSAILLQQTDGKQAVLRMASFPGAINPPIQAGQLLQGNR